jgi:hypothetical protein
VRMRNVLEGDSHADSPHEVVAGRLCGGPG